jgi:hypothetical protein
MEIISHWTVNMHTCLSPSVPNHLFFCSTNPSLNPCYQTADDVFNFETHISRPNASRQQSWRGNLLPLPIPNSYGISWVQFSPTRATPPDAAWARLEHLSTAVTALLNTSLPHHPLSLGRFASKRVLETPWTFVIFTVSGLYNANDST